jgi:hypothetical protein
MTGSVLTSGSPGDGGLTEVKETPSPWFAGRTAAAV